MLKCERCGVEYESEVHFHEMGEGSPLICIQCHQLTSRSKKQISKGGLIAAAVFVFFGVLTVVREPGSEGLLAFMYFATALALGIRSFLPGMTWGRGILTAVGGLLAGEIPVFLAISYVAGALGGPQVFVLVIIGVIAFALLKAGFKSGPIQWRKKKAEEPEAGRSPV
jgi:hypothetical protein